MGSAFAYSLCDSCGSAERCICANKSAGVISEKPDMILHTGDFAYNMDTNGGTTADNFFKNIQPVAANYPYMVSHGNHEDGDVALARYTESFRHMPTKTGTVKSVNGVAPNNWYFSWDSGLGVCSGLLAAVCSVLLVGVQCITFRLVQRFREERCSPEEATS